MPMTLGSPAFAHNGDIPALYTCDGSDLSPPLAWTDPPDGTHSLVLIVDDPDAPDPAAPKMTWVHWLLYDLPPTAGSLPAGVIEDDLPQDTQAGVNDWKHCRYGGPCPPVGKHRYFHKLYALDVKLGDLHQPTKAALEKAMDGHVLEKAELVGHYQRQR